MNTAAYQPVQLHGQSKHFFAVVILFQLVLLVLAVLGFKTIALTFFVMVFVPVLLLLPLDFSFTLFLASIFIFWKPVLGHQISDLLALLFVTLFFGWVATSGHVKLQSSPLLLSILLFLFVIGVSLLDAYNHTIAIKRYFRYVLLFITYWAVHNFLLSSGKIRQSLSGYLGLSIVGCITMIFELYFGHQTRVFGIGGIPFNDILVAANILAFSNLLFGTKNKGRKFSTFLFLLVSLILVQTRGAWLGFFLTTFFLLILLLFMEKTVLVNFLKSKLPPLLFVLTFLTTLVFTAYPQISDDLNQRIGQVSETQPQTQVTSLVSRVIIWDTAINVFKQHPINGIGLDLFPLASKEYYQVHPILFKWFIEGLDPHLLVLTFLCETGIIGTFGFVVLLLSAFRLSFKSFRIAQTEEEKSITLGLLGVIFFVIVSSCYAGSWFYGQNSYQFMFFLAAITAFYQVLKKRYETN